MATKRVVDREKVIDVSVKLADAEGFDSVTLAKVAKALNIRVPSLYNHVDGLNGLRSAIQLWGLERIADRMRRAAVGKAGDDAIMAVAEAYREFALEHPGVYRATLRAASDDEVEINTISDEILEIVFATLSAYHFDEQELIHVTRGLRSLLHGFVDLEISGGFGIPIDTDESFRRLVTLYVRGLAR